MPARKPVMAPMKRMRGVEDAENNEGEGGGEGGGGGERGGGRAEGGGVSQAKQAKLANIDIEKLLNKVHRS